MPQLYGTVYQTPTRHYEFASQSQINVSNSETSRISEVSFWRIMITVLEVGLTLLPGVGPMAQTAIGLGAAVANTALSASEGQVSGWGVGIDFASALIPGAVGLKYASKVKKGIATAETLKAEQASLKILREEAEERAFIKLTKGAERTSKKLERGEKIRLQSISKAKNLTKRILEGRLTREERMLLENVKIAGIEEKGLGMSRAARIEMAKLLEEYGTTLKKIEDTIREWKGVFDNVKHAIKKAPISKIASRRQLINELEKLVTGTGFNPNILKELYVPNFMKNAQVMKTSRLEARIKIETIKQTMSIESQELLEGAINAIYAAKMGTKETMKFMEDVIEAIGKRNPEDLQYLALLNKQDILDAFKVFSKGYETTQTRAIIKRVGSHNFNEKVVQRLQLIDPNDLGRAFPEWIYRKAKKRLEVNLARKAFKYGNKRAARLLKEASDIEDAFIKSGGKLFQPNRYIIGLKVIGGPSSARVVYVKFNKAYTAAKNQTYDGRKTKNFGGKKDILVRMTDTEIIRLLEPGGINYWWAVGKKRGWFVSRGGKRRDISSSHATISNELSLFLGLVPIPALRNILSITSNWVENIADMARGDYFKQWVPSVERALIRTSINRSFRLVTRYVIPGFAKLKAQNKILNKAYDSAKTTYKLEHTKEFKAFMEAAAKSQEMIKAAKRWEFLGREMQRLSTTILSTFEGRTKEGYFKFVPSSGEKLAKKIFLQAAPNSIRGATIRKSTRVAHQRGTPAYGRQLIGARRNLGQIGRIYSAVTPNGSVKPLRNITRFK